MRKIFIKLYTGYCGEEAADVWEVFENKTDEQIDLQVWEAAKDHAESYGHSDEWDEGEEESWEEFTDRVDFTWEDYDPKKHDMYF